MLQGEKKNVQYKISVGHNQLHVNSYHILTYSASEKFTYQKVLLTPSHTAGNENRLLSLTSFCSVKDLKHRSDEEIMEGNTHRGQAQTEMASSEKEEAQQEFFKIKVLTKYTRLTIKGKDKRIQIQLIQKSTYKNSNIKLPWQELLP